jgi:hypothetical protein
LNRLLKSPGANHGFRLDDHGLYLPVWLGVAKESSDHPVSILQSRALGPLPEDAERVAEGDFLEHQPFASPKWSSDELQSEIQHPARLEFQEL